MALPEWLHWDKQHHRLLFLGQPATLFWQQPSLVALLTPLYEELGEDYFSLLIGYSTKDQAETDYQTISHFDSESFVSGLLHWGEKIAAAGWGEITGATVDEALSPASLVIKNPWEQAVFPNMQTENMLPFFCGKLSGILSQHFRRNVRARVVEMKLLEGDYIAQIRIAPSNQSLETELAELSQQAHLTQLEKLKVLNQQLQQKNKTL